MKENFKFKAEQITEEVLDDLLKNNESKYQNLNNEIIEKFNIKRDEYSYWLEDNDLRIYVGIDYYVVIDSWFEVQHGFSGSFEIVGDEFKIIPPEMWADYFENTNLVYPNTKEGLEKAFFDTKMQEYVAKFKVGNIEYFVCKDEI